MPLTHVISFFFFTLSTSVNEFLSSSVRKCWFLRGKSEYLFEQSSNFASMWEQLLIFWMWLQQSQRSGGGALGLQWLNASGAAWFISRMAEMFGFFFFWRYLSRNFSAYLVLFIDSLILTVIILETSQGIAEVWRVMESTSLGLSSIITDRVIVWLSKIFAYW